MMRRIVNDQPASTKPVFRNNILPSQQLESLWYQSDIPKASLLKDSFIKQHRSSNTIQSLSGTFSPKTSGSIAYTEGASTTYGSHSNALTSTDKITKKQRPVISLSINNSRKFIVDSQAPSSQRKTRISELIQNVQEKIVLPMKKEIKANKTRTRNLSNDIDIIKTHLSTVTEDLTKTVYINQAYITTNKITSFNIERIQIENDDIQKEIKDIYKNKDKLFLSTCNFEKDTVRQINEYNSLKENVDSMRKSSLYLSELCANIQEEKKLMISTLILIRKKIFELKRDLYGHEKTLENVEGELELLLKS